MKKLASSLFLGALISTSVGPVVAQERCENSRNFGYGAFSQLYDNPVIGESIELNDGALLERKTVIASRSITIPTMSLELLSGSQMIDPNGKSFSTNVPVVEGANVNLYRNGDQTRACLLAWQNGLFGGATGDGHVRWVCFEDRDQDGAFESAWRLRGSKNNRVEMSLTPQLAYQKANLALDDSSNLIFTRELRVRKIKKDAIHLELREGFGGRLRSVGDEVVVTTELPSAQIEGLTLSFEKLGNKQYSVTTVGEFVAPNILVQCDGTRVKNGDSFLQRTFGFAPW